MTEITIKTSKIDITSSQKLLEATLYLSKLNKRLDEITAHKEAKTRPINEALKKIRQDYKLVEDELNTLIEEVRTSIIKYHKGQELLIKEKEQLILKDKRTSLETKITLLSDVNQIKDKVSTLEGSLSFITIKKYTLQDSTKVPPTLNLLILDTTALKEYLKKGNPIPQGISETEEKTIRNYRK